MRPTYAEINLSNLRYNFLNKDPSIILFGGRFPLYLSSYFFDNKEGGKEEGGKWMNTFVSNNNLSFKVSEALVGVGAGPVDSLGQSTFVVCQRVCWKFNNRCVDDCTEQ